MNMTGQNNDGRRDSGYTQYGNYSSRERNVGSTRAAQSRDNLPKKIEAQSLPSDFVSLAEDVIRGGNWSKLITTSKIRRLFSLCIEIYNLEKPRTSDSLLPESITRLQLAQIRMLYEVGRDKKQTGEFLVSARLVEYLKDIGNSREKLLHYFHYMEALVAYHKFYGGKE